MAGLSHGPNAEAKSLRATLVACKGQPSGRFEWNLPGVPSGCSAMIFSVPVRDTSVVVRDAGQIIAGRIAVVRLQTGFNSMR